MKSTVRRLLLLSLALVWALSSLTAATLGTFRTPLGSMEVEFYDEDKPVTVSNFIKYVQSGRFSQQFIQRWEPNFVIQAGGFYTGSRPNGDPDFRTVSTYGNIVNEYSIGRIFSNTYGTLAMARQSGVVNSASSQWFINLTNNAFLDSVDSGFTVFAKVTAGTNVLQNFIQAPPANPVVKRVRVPGYRNDYNEPITALGTLPTLGNPTTFDQLFTNLIYIDISLRRDFELKIARSGPNRELAWKTASGVTNALEYANSLRPGNSIWITLTNTLGTGSMFQYIDTANDPARTYRVRLVY